MTWFYLVLHMGFSAASPAVVIPQPYSSKAECEAAAASWAPRSGAGFACIPAPRDARPL